MTYNASDVVAGTNATAPEYNNLRKDYVTGRNTVKVETDGATVTFNLNNGKIQEVTLGGNRTLALSNDNVGQTFVIVLRQDATGSRTVTWWSGIEWAGGTAPTLTTTASKDDVFGFIQTGASTYYGFVIGQNH